MIFDGNDVSPDVVAGYDLVIVGTGIAGQALLLTLLPTDLRIAVIESGSEVATAATDELKRVRTPRYSIGDDSRERYLGGSANTWGQGCVKLDPIDLEQRAWVSHSGWPITRSELEPFYQSACRLLEITDADEIDVPDGGFVLDGGGLTTRFLLYTKRFADFDPVLLETMGDSERIDLFLGSNVVGLEANQNEDRIDRLTIKTIAGASFAVEGARFVLACGGIENSRLLLISSTADGRGIGNRHDNVGRYFMEHPKNVLGAIRPADDHVDLWPYTPCTIAGQKLRGGLSVTEDIQRREQTLNSHARFIVERKWERNPGVRAISALIRGTSVPAATVDDPGDFPVDETNKFRLIGSIIVNLPQIIQFGLHKVRRRTRPIERIWLKNLVEMEPVRENRVRLDDAIDRLGTPRAVVDYAPTDLDKRTVEVLHRTIAERVSTSGFGALESPLLESMSNWNLTRDAAHHMGGTRMGTDPETSVTDPDGRVHGIANLYVSGSSVFPAGGYANPTMTIVALAIRLAEHLRNQSTAATGPASTITADPRDER